MESNKSIPEFHILPFFMKFDNKLYIFNIVFFYFIYFFGILVNLLIISVICLDVHLHTPMYLFLCNLSIIDMCYTTVNVPQLLYILLSGKNTICYTQCYIQMYFFLLADSSEIMVLFIVAYDRYVAICHPLDYHRILNRKTCVILILAIWISGCFNSVVLIRSVLKMVFCSSFTIHQFFCDAKALINISCGGTEMFYLVMYIDIFLFGVCPMVCNFLSYIQILKIILCIQSKEGRSKAFSTCSSHLTVMIIFYGSAFLVYLTPPSDLFGLMEQILTVFYTTVVPILNPLIYSLRNKDVKNALQKLLVFW